MMTITAKNSTSVQKAPPAPKAEGYRTQRHAQAAAVATIGEHARSGFEFETHKEGALWWWRHIEGGTLSPAQIKADGGKRSLLAMAQQISGAIVPAGAATTPTGGTAVAKVEPMNQKDDGLDIPDFLKRPSETVEQRDSRRKRQAKMAGPDRKLKDPPSVEEALKRAAKREAEEAKFEGSPAAAKAKRKAAFLAKVAQDKPKAKKPTSKSPTKTAGQSVGPEAMAVIKRMAKTDAVAVKPTLAKAIKDKGKKSKIDICQEMLQRGTTQEEMIKFSGWPRVYMPDLIERAKKKGLPHKFVEKDGLMWLL